MKVFISWSGDHSRRIADALRRWLPGVLQAVKPYFSPDDVAKGARWSGEIAKELETARLGLLVLTPDNLSAPWLVFEAGALAKNLEHSKVCPLLFGVEPTDITGPLVQFQAARFDAAEMKRVVKMMNAELGDDALQPDVLDSVFEMWWPKLETQIQQELARPAQTDRGARTERDLLEEALTLIRSMSRGKGSSFEWDKVERAVMRDLALRSMALVKAIEDLTITDPILLDPVAALLKPVRYLTRAVLGESEPDLLGEFIRTGVLTPVATVTKPES